ncbi:MAG: NUDIX hydrolase [Pseudomonadota bacterium]
MLPEDQARELHRGRYLTLQERRGWEFIHRLHPVVVMVAWTPDDELVLVEQYREPLQASTIELPAGLVGDEAGHEDEGLLLAAARELEEETGWRAGSMAEIMRCPTSAGMSDEIAVFIRASELVKVGEGGGTPSENITVHVVARDRIDRWLDEQREDGKQLDPKIYSVLHWSRTR